MENLKMLRKSQKLSQKALGDKISLSGNTIGQYENNEREPGVETLKKLARYFNVTIDYLVDYEAVNHLVEVPKQQQQDFTEQQKRCIDLLKQMNDIECLQVETFIKTMQNIKNSPDMDTLRILKN